MKILHSILSVMLPIVVLSCSTIKEQNTIFPTAGEYYRWEIRDFIQGKNLSYQVDDSLIFKLEEPFHKIGEEDIIMGDGLNVIALKAQDISKNGAWTNKFAILGLEEFGESVIYYSEGKQALQNEVPRFTNKIIFNKFNPLLQCYDLEYVDNDTFLVDCMEKQDYYPGKNFVIFITKGLSVTISSQEVPNHYGYDIVSARKIQYYAQQHNDKKQLILLRGQYAYGTPGHSTKNLDGNCLIELLLNSENNQIVDAMRIFNKGLLINDLNIPYDQYDQFQFTLIDFKILPNGHIYILDAYNGIYIYQITQDLRWKLVKRYGAGFNQAYAFDVINKIDEDEENHVHIVILYQNIFMEYIDGLQSYGQSGKFVAEHPASINYSGEFIVIKINFDYYLFKKQDGQIATQSISAQKYLVNPSQPDLIAVSNSRALRYEIGQAKISVYSTKQIKKENILYFSATDSSGQICKASFKYKIISKIDTSIYQEQSHTPQLVISPSDPILIEGIAKGPGLVYTIGNETILKDITINLNKIQDLNTDFSLPFAANVTYSNIIINPNWSDKTKFWFMYQLKNKQVEIQECKADSIYSPNFQCQRFQKFKLSKVLDSQKTQIDWAQGEDQLLITFMQNNYEINFFEVSNDMAEIVYQLKYEQIEENRISSFTILRNLIFVVQLNLKQVDVWNGLQKYYTINKSTITLQDSDKTFEPKRIFSNSALSRDFILIQSKDCVFFGEMKNTFYLIFEFPILKNSEVQVYLGKKTIFIIQKNNNSFKIDEWNYENLHNIYLMKSLPFYNRYEIQLPLTSDYCFESGFLFILAFDSQLEQNVVLVYQSQVLMQESLHKVIEANLKVQEGVSTILKAAGNEQMFLYINDQNSQKLFGFLKNTILTLTPNQESKQYFANLNIAINITNQDILTPKQVIYPIKFINTQTQITINQTALSKVNNEFQFKFTSQEQYLNIITDNCQNGQILKYQVECKQCQPKFIQIMNPIHQLTDGSQFSEQIYSAISTKKGMIFQTKNSLIFKDEKDNFVGTYKLPFSKFHYDCVSTATDNGEVVFTGCILDQDNVIIYLSFCDGNNCFPAEPQSQSILANQISKLLYKDGILFVLDNNIDYHRQQGSVRIHNVNLDEVNKTWKLDDGIIVNSQYLKDVITTPFKPADFDVIKYEVDNHEYYKVLITSNAHRIYFVDLYFDFGVLEVIQNDNFEIYDFISGKFVLNDDTEFYQVRALKSTIQNYQLLCTALISTSNFATYAITFTFDISDVNNQGAHILNKVQVPFLLSNYGGWNNLNKLDVFDDYAVLAQTNNINNLISVYKLPQINHTTKEEIETQTITFFGGEKFELIENISIPLVLTLSQDVLSNKIVLYTNLFYIKDSYQTQLIKYSIYDYPQLSIKKGNQIIEQDVLITAINDYSTASGVLRLTQLKETPHQQQNQDQYLDDEKFSQFEVISAIFTVGATLIGFAVYYGH